MLMSSLSNKLSESETSSPLKSYSESRKIRFPTFEMSISRFCKFKVFCSKIQCHNLAFVSALQRISWIRTLFQNFIANLDNNFLSQHLHDITNFLSFTY